MVSCDGPRTTDLLFIHIFRSCLSMDWPIVGDLSAPTGNAVFLPTSQGCALVVVHKSVVPEGRLIIAQQFTAGCEVKTRNVVPEGRLKTVPERLNRPSGTNDHVDFPWTQR